MTDNVNEKKSSPFVHTIRIGWADCDPALIAYTGRIPYFALESIDAWWEAHTDCGWYQLNLDHNVGTPFVHMSVDFKSPITPRNKLDCEVTLLKIGNTSIRFQVKGLQNGVLCFEGQFVCVFVVSKIMKPEKPPEKLLCMIRPLIQAG